MELDPANPSEAATGGLGSNHSGTSMEECSMVPDLEGDGNNGPDPDPQEHGSAVEERGSKRSRQKSSLDPPSVARKRLHYSDVGLSTDAADMILDNPQARRRFFHYGPAQQVYIDWVKKEGKDPDTPDPIVLVNYLAYQMRTRKWKSSTTQAKRTAILALFTDRLPITNSPLYQDFMAAIKIRQIRPAQIGSINISPALEFLRSLPTNEVMPFLHLTRKLCWLLGVCGFLRPDDIRCIDVCRSTWSTSTLVLFIPLPKEKRMGNRIEKTVTIHANKDPRLCPVAAYACYLTRTADHPLEIPHPKDNEITITPLIRNSRDLNYTVSSETISNHMDTISVKIPEVERSSRR
ncbi:hypothetical protein BGZ72_002661, partial [Mortierella alpina]